MKRVLLGSMPVGGGHNALRDSFLKILQDADPSGQSFETVTFTAQDPRVPSFYEFTVHYVPWFQRVIWEMGRTRSGVRLSTIVNAPLYREVVDALTRHRPDVVVSTHFLLSMMFARARHELGLDVTVVSAIPDYGEPTRAFYPAASDLRADYTICMDANVFRQVVDTFDADPERMHLSGFVPRQPFVDLGRQIGDERRLPRHARRAILERLRNEHPTLAGFDPDRPTVIFLGGSAWTEKTMPVIEELLRNPEFADHLNVLVISGKNASFRQTLSERVAHLPRFFVFGFVPPTQMAELIALSDVPVLGSLAPASMHELLELRSGPMMLFHLIPGSEDAHAAWITNHGVGLYEPDPFLMTDLLMQATGFKKAHPEMARLLANAPERARDIRQEHQSRALEFAQFVARIGGVVPLHVPAVPAFWQPPGAELRANAAR